MLTLTGTDTLSDCPGCGGRDFTRASLFGAGGLTRGRRIVGPAASTSYGAPGPVLASHADTRHGARTRGGRAGGSVGERAGEVDTPGTATLGGALSQPEPCDGAEWLEDVRSRIASPGEYLAYEYGDELRTVALTREWTRIGRSLVADVRFDDPTVSRRHALVVRQPDGVRVLDDRSLNGVFVNGSRIEWKTLQDGDEIVVGRYRLRFLSVPALGDGAAAPPTLHGAG